MYNEFTGREYARYRMREAQQEAQNVRMLASMEEIGLDESGQSAIYRLGHSIQVFIETLNLSSDLAGSE